MSGVECSICLDTSNPSLLAIQTPCNHSFHLVCLRRIKKQEFPNCRHDLRQFFDLNCLKDSDKFHSDLSDTHSELSDTDQNVINNFQYTLLSRRRSLVALDEHLEDMIHRHEAERSQIEQYLVTYEYCERSRMQAEHERIQANRLNQEYMIQEYRERFRMRAERERIQSVRSRIQADRLNQEYMIYRTQAVRSRIQASGLRFTYFR